MTRNLGLLAGAVLLGVIAVLVARPWEPPDPAAPPSPGGGAERATPRGEAAGLVEPQASRSIAGGVRRPVDVEATGDSMAEEDSRSDLAVAGVVCWPNGTTVDGSFVEVHRHELDPWDDVPYRKHLEGFETRADGRFEFRNLGDGPFDLIACSGRSHHGSELQGGVVLGVPEGTSTVKIVLERLPTIAGRAIDEQGTPITSFTVRAGCEPPTFSPEHRGPVMEQEFDSTDGSFVLGGLWPGQWRIGGEADGYVLVEGLPVMTVPGNEAPVVLVFTRLIPVHGLVLDPHGVPVEGAGISKHGADMPWRGPIPFWEPWIVSGPDGRFESDISVLGATAFVAEHPDWAPSGSVTVETIGRDGVAEVVLHLRHGGRITGLLYDKDGVPAPDRNVHCGLEHGMADRRGMNTRTDAAGEFVFEHVTPGKTVVAAVPTQAEIDELELDEALAAIGEVEMETVVVEDGHEVHVVLGERPASPVRVHGRVTAMGEAIDEGLVFLAPAEAAEISGAKAGPVTADGNYEITVDRPGPYWLVCQKVEWGVAGFSRRIDVPEGPEFPLDIELPSGRISGRVLLSDGRAAGRVAVWAFAEEFRSAAEGMEGVAEATCDEAGAYVLRGLPPGTYTVHVGPRIGLEMVGFSSSNAGGGWGRTVACGVVVAAEQHVRDLDFELQPAGAVSGTVRDEHGNPVGGAGVFVRGAEGRLHSPVAHVLTNAAGGFAIPDLEPGPITLSARGAGLACGDTPILAVQAGETVHQDLVLQAGVLLEVQVLADGKPAFGRWVVLDGEGRKVNGMRSPSTDPRGAGGEIADRYRPVGPLPPGAYTIQASGEDGRSARRRVRLREGQTTRKVKLRLK